MTWIRRAEAKAAPHQCATPEREETYTAPAPPPLASGKGADGQPVTFTLTVPDGTPGDLWRCDDCGQLWRRHRAPDEWRPAGWWLRVRYRERVGTTAP